MTFEYPARGTPLAPDRWYLPPAYVAPVEGIEQYQARLGDIYSNVPSLCVDQRPLRIARDWQDPKSGRWAYTARTEDDEAARPPFDWAAGEQFVVTGKRALGVLLTQDCEIEKPHAVLAFALVRSIDHSIPAEAIATMRERRRYRSFFLAAQDDPPFPAGYVDFGRITSIERGAVRGEDRLLSMSDDVRDAMRMDYIQFCTQERDE
jgi:hypothetical protein